MFLILNLLLLIWFAGTLLHIGFLWGSMGNEMWMELEWRDDMEPDRLDLIGEVIGSSLIWPIALVVYLTSEDDDEYEEHEDA